MSADNVLGWEIVLKISHLPSKLRFSAKCSFFGQSLSHGHYQPTYQPPEGVYLLNMTPFSANESARISIITWVIILKTIIFAKVWKLLLKKQNSEFLLSVEKCALCNWQLKSLNLSIALVWRCSSYALSYQNITVFLGEYKLKIFLRKFVGHSVWYFCLRMYLVVGWCYSNCRASLQVF